MEVGYYKVSHIALELDTVLQIRLWVVRLEVCCWEQALNKGTAQREVAPVGRDVENYPLEAQEQLASSGMVEDLTAMVLIADRCSD